LAGGLTGQALEGMVERTGLAAVRIPLTGLTRVSHVLLEESTGQEYRFTPEGPEVDEAEWQHYLEVLAVFDAPLCRRQRQPRPRHAGGLLCAGGLAGEGAPRADVVDSSGPPLQEALAEGVHLIKPSRGELEKLLGRKVAAMEEAEALALAVVHSGRAEIVALTLGCEGAILVTHDGTIRLTSPKVKTRSAVVRAMRSWAP
jgi:6-phosphofructokinase 2